MKNVFDFFDKIYCINLPDSQVRWNQVAQQFSKVGILPRVERVWADRPWPEITLPTLKFPRGELGVTFSQTKALVHALASTAKNVLIFEDDVTFEDNTPEILQQALTELPASWEIFFLGGNPVSPMSPFSKTLYTTGDILCAHAYAVSRPAMLKLYDDIMNKVTLQPYDGITSLLAKQGNGYITNPQLCWTADGESVIRNAFRSYRTAVQNNWNKYKPPQ